MKVEKGLVCADITSWHAKKKTPLRNFWLFWSFNNKTAFSVWLICVSHQSQVKWSLDSPPQAPPIAAQVLWYFSICLPKYWWTDSHGGWNDFTGIHHLWQPRPSLNTDTQVHHRPLPSRRRVLFGEGGGLSKRQERGVWINDGWHLKVGFLWWVKIIDFPHRSESGLWENRGPGI